MAEDKKLTFEETLKHFKKTYGAKVALGKDVPKSKRMPTGSLALDIGTRGWPLGRITTLAGKKSVAKTATAFHAIAMGQKIFPDKQFLWISMEPFDEGWAVTNGVDLNRLVVVEPETGEDAINIWDAFLDTRDLGVAVFDSLGAIVSEQELEREAEYGAMNLRAKLQKRLMLKTNARLHVTKDGKRNDCAILMLTHIYNTPDQYNPEVIAGGEATQSNSSLIMSFRQKGFIWDGKEKESDVIGIEVAVRVNKDKTKAMAKPFEFYFFNQDGITNNLAKGGTYNDVDSLIQEGQLVPSLEEPYIKKGGAWYEVMGQKFQGQDKLREFMFTQPDFCREVEKKVREHYGIDFPEYFS